MEQDAGADAFRYSAPKERFGMLDAIERCYADRTFTATHVTHPGRSGDGIPSATLLA